MSGFGRAAGAATLLVATCLARLALGQAAEAPASQPPSSATFATFLSSLRPEAEARGVSSATFDAAMAGLRPDSSVAALTRRQPELAKPTGAYLAAQVTPARIAQGRGLVERWHRDLDAIAARSGVPGAIVVAIWGLETNYGTSPGAKDVIRSMATLAAMGYRPDLYRAELLAALDILERGEASRAQLRGSWAGAMGQPQFMPSSFARYAVDGDGDGRRDIWEDVPDVLASMANFLRQHGWRAGLPWGFEVRLPAGFDIGVAGRVTFANWAARGVRRTDDAALPADGEGTLYFPAGAGGPAFLVTSNFEVIKTYNFSDSYVLSVGTLADRMEGGPAIAGQWPTEPPISRPDRIALQARLTTLGYPVDDHDGRVSLTLRDTIRVAQLRNGLVPDGNPTAALLRAVTRGP